MPTVPRFARSLAGVVGFSTVTLGGFAGAGPATASVEEEPLAKREERPSCSEALSVKQTTKGASCWIDERVTASPGRLDFPCGGGAATAVFGESSFSGSVDGGAVDVGLKTRFTWSDGCTWESTQRITGKLADRKLTFTYREAPLAGQKDCAPACAAEGAVDLR